VTALVAATVAITASPAFADKGAKGGLGHQKATSVDNLDGTIDTSLQQSGRYPNLNGGPGSLKERITIDPNAIETKDPVVCHGRHL
jgi:hypothetical protein